MISFKEKAARAVGVGASLGICALWIAFSLRPNVGGTRYILIAATMIIAALIAALGAARGRAGLMLAAAGVSAPAGLYMLATNSLYSLIGIFTLIILVMAILLHESQRENRLPAAP